MIVLEVLVFSEDDGDSVAEQVCEALRDSALDGEVHVMEYDELTKRYVPKNEDFI